MVGQAGGFLQGNMGCAAVTQKPQAMEQGCTDRKHTKRRGLAESPPLNPLIHESVTMAKWLLLVTLLPSTTRAPAPRDTESGC